jgi:hypothetical protein
MRRTISPHRGNGVLRSLDRGAMMPTIIRFGNMVIRMFADDHNPPHFHIVTPEHQNMDIALNWARANKTRLEQEWSRLNER